MEAHVQTVQRQFDPQAQAYLSSQVHAQGPDLAWVRGQFLPTLPAASQALDLGCGAGHLAFALAERCARVTAFDPSPSMLATVRQEAAARGFAHIDTVEGLAQQLPFATGQFDVVASRYSAHHWEALPAALAEIRRVLKPGGALLMIDVEGDDSPLVDTHLQAMELLRDRSHIRNRAPSEWQRLLTEAGFVMEAHLQWPTRLAFDSWIARMRTPQTLAQAIRALQEGAPAEVRAALRLETDGSFGVTTGAMVARPR
ncbi:MAG: class I SAM-dependent methyltransferase [Paludibacterium sp.]|uniref:class I SAM-dependent methyltransferase n=1 Tax=Paludibacterium sp. TaxID=1917523 RepID=UPI0025D6AD49|nr:class I SAM-dependent methyltransferase [Paludibacterium sp.]MBV8046183.1 class I SAM-dependent methyltransferase [Paludibacterium sp.]MBV8649322.1 class I SAM-dependent methyltransferase [Paludibacterium sp.]